MAFSRTMEAKAAKIRAEQAALKIARARENARRSFGHGGPPKRHHSLGEYCGRCVDCIELDRYLADETVKGAERMPWPRRSQEKRCYSYQGCWPALEEWARKFGPWGFDCSKAMRVPGFKLKPPLYVHRRIAR